MAFENDKLTIEIAARNLAGPALEQVKQQLGNIDAASQKTAGATSRLEGMMGRLNGALAALPIAAGVALLHQFHDSVVKLAVRINDQSEALGLNVRQYQALRVAASQAGVEETKMVIAVSNLNVKIGEATQGKKEAIEAFDRLGVKILDINGKQRAESAILEEVALKLSKVDDVAKRAAMAKDLLGVSGARLSALLKVLGDGLERTASAAERAGMIMDKETVAALEKADRAMKEATLSLQVMYAQFAAPIVTSGLAEINKFLKTTREELDMIVKLYGAVRDFLNPGSAAGRVAGGTAGRFSAPVTVPMPTPPGVRQPPVVASGSERDRGADSLAALTAQIREVNEAYLTLRTTSTDTAKDSIAAAELHMRIETQLAQTLRNIPANDPRREQIIAQTRALEEARARYDDFKKAMQFADQTQAKFGDGTREHVETMRLLNEALETGRLTQDAYAAAVTGANEALAAQRDRALEAQGGMAGFGAGFNSAMRAYEKSNSTFRQGGQLFEGTVTLMSDALTRFVETGELSFKRLGASFASMIAQMAFKAAASGLMKIGGELLSSALSSIIGGFFAEGGRPPVGKPSIVGERGAEVFVPDVAGTVYNQAQLASMGGSTVVIEQHFASGVSGPSRAQWMAWQRDTVTAAVAAVRMERVRGGKYAQAFR